MNKKNIQQSSIEVSEKTPKKPNKKRMTIELGENSAQLLEWLSEIEEISQTEVIRRAIGTEAFLQKEILNGGKVFVQTSEGLKEIVFR